MARPPQIRLTKNDRTEYARLVKNAKAKINRTIKEKGSQVVVEKKSDNGEVFYETMDIRDMVSIPDLGSITTRKQFNEIKQQLSSFTNRNNMRFQFKVNPFGVVSTQATINAIERNTKVAQRRAEQKIEERKKLPFIHNREVVGTQEERMRFGAKNQGIDIPVDFHFEKMRFPKQLLAKATNMWNKTAKDFYEKRAHNAKMQLARTIDETFNGFADELVEKLKNLPDDVFEMMYQTFEEFEFENWNISPQDGYYPDEATSLEARNLTSINYYLDMYYEGRLHEISNAHYLKDF